MKLKEASDGPHGPRFTRPWIVASRDEIPEGESSVVVSGPEGKKEIAYEVYGTHDGYVERTKKGTMKVPKPVGEKLLKDPGVVGIEKAES